MILPSKHLDERYTLLHIGSQILFILKEPKNLSYIWSEIKKQALEQHSGETIRFDWFILALDFLFALAVIELRDDGLIRRVKK